MSTRCRHRVLPLVIIVASALWCAGQTAPPLSAQAASVINHTSAGERHIDLQGAANFRDLGGYPTADGRHVRWKRIYRTGSCLD